jgi:CheY-like chemotaxis protein
MLRLRLIHWKAAEADRYLALLTEAGHHVEYSPEFSPKLMRVWRETPPDAFVIDLSRLPSHGREIAIALRQSKATRAIPLVFCEGDPAKIAKTRETLPDAVYCSLSRLKSTLRKLPKAASAPVVPPAMMDRYAGRSAAQKLGVKANGKVCLLGAPRDITAVLGEVPFVESPTEAAVTLLFASEPQEMQRELSNLRPVAAQTKLWVCWKKGKSRENGLGETLVRETGLALGLVDYKVCSINEVWSGLLFAAPKNSR